MKGPGTVLSERGLKETKETNGDGKRVDPVTSSPYDDEDVVLLHQHLHEPEKYEEDMKAEIKQREADKKKKNKCFWISSVIMCKPSQNLFFQK